MWFQKNKGKIITSILVIAVLAGAFYYGGNAPGSKGWEIPGNLSSGSTQLEDAITDSQQALDPSTSDMIADPSGMLIDPETGKDKYLTDPVPEGKPAPVEPQDVTIGTDAYTCTISISCSTILDNMDLCDPDKVDLVPEDGWILRPIVVTFYEGESVFNVLQRVCKQ